jgi:multidrug efflux pump subunit AcrB
MVFGVAMDYTLFMLSAAKEHYETHAHPEHAMIGSVRSSGRVVLSAAAVMIAVFLTFALSGPLAPKEMGVILAVAVALDALVVRLVLLPIVLRYGQPQQLAPAHVAGAAPAQGPLLALSEPWLNAPEHRWTVSERASYRGTDARALASPGAASGSPGSRPRPPPWGPSRRRR